MNAYLACSSHSPLMLLRPRVPDIEATVLEHRARCRAAIEAFDPEQIVCVANNHFAGFHYSVMPPYCIGLEAVTVPDLGGFDGPVRVPKVEAMALLERLRDAGFDPAVSYRMRLDHAFTQPLGLLVGGLDRYPVIPVFVSVFTPPHLSFRRSRLFGEALGRAILASGKRTLIMGSGGPSHHPARYFPTMEEAPPDVFAYQMDGDRGGSMTDAQWLERFATMHRDGAKMTSEGLRTPKQMHLNAELDRQVLSDMAAGRLTAFDDWQAPWVVEQGGIGMLELHSWVIANAALRQCVPQARLESFHAEVVEYGVGFGMLYGPH
jgi:2,3-dihydroxyphenylpropionate 1,2-dioxygenase